MNLIKYPVDMLIMGKCKFEGRIRQLIVDAYQTGASLNGLAQLHNCNLVTIRNLLLIEGVILRPPGGCTALSDEQARELTDDYKDGLSQQKLTAKYHCSQPTIGRLLRRFQIETRARPNLKGKRHPAWKGGRTQTKQGYVRIWVDKIDPLACMKDNAGYVLEHRLVMARYLNRALFSWETVHHKDDIKSHNNIENLQLRIGKHGRGIALKCQCCGGVNLIPVEI